jgi:hypothetical protein
MSAVPSASAGDIPLHIAPQGSAHPDDLTKTKLRDMQVRFPSDHLSSHILMVRCRKIMDL